MEKKLFGFVCQFVDFPSAQKDISQLPLQLDVSTRLSSGRLNVDTRDVHQLQTSSTNLLRTVFALFLHHRLN